MTNTILTDEQREAFIVQTVGAKSEILSELLHKHESAVLAELVQRAGVEAVAWRWVWASKPDDIDGWCYTNTPPLYPDKQIIQSLYPPEAIAQLQATIEALRGEVERLTADIPHDVRCTAELTKELIGVEAERAQLQARIEALSAEVERMRVLKRKAEEDTDDARAYGKEADEEVKQLRAQLEAQGEAVGWQGQWLDMSDNCEGWSSWKNIEPCDVEGWQKRKARYPDSYNLRQVFTHPAPAAPVVEPTNYRLLQSGVDRIEPTDEFLSEDTSHWAIDPNAIFAGMLFGGNALRPARRALHPTKPKGEKA